MSSPHLLRSFPGRQIGLIEGDDAVVIFGVLGGRYAGPTMLAHVPTLTRRINELATEIKVVVFIDEATPVSATVARIDAMLAAFDDAEALVCFQRPTEAVKEVAGRTVLRGVDRSQLAAVVCPEVILRSSLQKALERERPELWVNPTALVAAGGGRVKLFSERASA
jgi:2-C-methyl-D-erythritol 4-phosphate cytidylyltransferase